MKYSRGNEKLGRGCFVISRAVGDTCPWDCRFLHNGCYAEFSEKRFPMVRPAGLSNATINWESIWSLVTVALDNDYSIRIHERGDFGVDNKLDMKYITAWRKALRLVVKQRETLPYIWFYTHFYRKTLADLASFPNVAAYASVDNAEHIRKAKKCGFKLFAYCTTIRRKKGDNTDKDKYLQLPVIGRTLVCPEQRMGKARVTCTKDKDNTACNWCVQGKGNIAFLEH